MSFSMLANTVLYAKTCLADIYVAMYWFILYASEWFEFDGIEMPDSEASIDGIAITEKLLSKSARGSFY